MAFTDFWADPLGDNRNSGTTFNTTFNLPAAPFYSTTGGNWNASTRRFTPTNGSNPFASGVRVGDFVSVFLDSAVRTGYVSRVTAVTNAVNGSITVSAAPAGVAPATSNGNMSLRDGGTWAGPVDGSSFPWSLTNLGNLLPADPAIGSGFTTRIYFTNRVSPDFQVTAQINVANPQTLPVYHVAYALLPERHERAGFRAIGSLGPIILVNVTWVGAVFYGLSFIGSLTATGNADLVQDSSGSLWQSCAFGQARGAGLQSNGGTVLECMAYDCNRANIDQRGGFSASGSTTDFIRCTSHSHATSKGYGYVGMGRGIMEGCIAMNCGAGGVAYFSGAGYASVRFCDFYNLGGAAIGLYPGGVDTGRVYLVENCNFLKCAGGAFHILNVSVSGQWPQGKMYNCGYGTGTMANGADVLGNVQQVDCFEYPADTTPWDDPDIGHFSLISDLAVGGGRGDIPTRGFVFSGVEDISPTYTGKPDVGALQFNPFASPNPAPAPGGGPSKGKEPPVKIVYKDRDITDLVDRNRKAVNTIRNFKIVGEGVAGDINKGFSVND